MAEKLTMTLERVIPASVERVWELWTTPEGIEQWWSPDGFRTDVDQLDLRVGGELVHTMTAEAPDMVAFMQQNGMPLSNTARKTFTEIEKPYRLAYESLVDFVPGHEPYQHLTVVELAAEDSKTKVTMRMEPLHDDVWTERLVTGRSNELTNLEKLVLSSNS